MTTTKPPSQDTGPMADIDADTDAGEKQDDDVRVVPVHLARAGQALVLRHGPRPPRPRGRIPRIARLLALAHHFQRLLDTGVCATQTELAALAKITTARCTQIMSLLVLAPDIQEEILFLAPVRKGRGAITERKLRPVLDTLVWSEQRARWRALPG